MADAYSLGVTTIEYTDYPKNVLLATNHKSFGYQYIDYFINENKDIIGEQTQKSLYLLDVKPLYEIQEDSRNDYEDSWFVMDPQIEERNTQTSVSSKSKNVL